VGLDESFEDSLVGVSADRGAQAHSADKGVTGKQAAVFHGQGGSPDAEKTALREYLSHVESTVTSHMQDKAGFLVLAGVDYLTANYQQHNRCARLLEPTISGSVDHLSPDELLQRAMPIVTENLRTQREADAIRIREQRHNPVATDPEPVLCAAFDGRVDTIFADENAVLQGSFFPETRTLHELHHAPTGAPGDPSHDLIEIAIVEVLRHGGRVHSVSTAEMPVDATMAAAMRY
jgi:hypothetical protein